MLTTTFNVFFLIWSLNFCWDVVVVVDAHGYLKSPRSRNFVAYQDGVWWGSRSDQYGKENCPHCANGGGRCGTIGRQDYNLPRSITDDLMPADPQVVYQRGDVITVDIVLTAHHMGHFEFKACPINHGVIPTQECFDQNPLEFVSDNLYGATKDSSFPERAYIPPSSFSGIQRDTSPGIVTGYKFEYNYRLPPSLEGDFVLLQWHYITANTCEVPGYRSYSFPSQWGNFGGVVGQCNLPISSDGGGAPEQFWNCAEIQIIPGQGPPPESIPTEAPIARAPSRFSPNPTPAPPTPAPINPTPAPIVDPTPAPINPTPAPIVDPTPAPIINPTPAPIVDPTPAPIDDPTPAPIVDPTPAPIPMNQPPVSNDNYCGNASVGNGICEDSSKCCSKWGWCGYSAHHCQNQLPPPSPTTPVNTPTPPPTSAPIPSPTFASTPSPTKASNSNIFCGNGVVGNGACENTNQCCSGSGWCGNSSAHCQDSGTPDSCGNGVVGNGVCPDPTMCCSKHGWCGNSPAHCN